MKVPFALILILIYVEVAAQPRSIRTTFAGKTGGDISKKDFIDANKLEIVSSDNDTTLKVESFRIAIAGKGTNYREFNIKGNQITHEVDSTISKMPTGVKIFIDPLIVKNPKTISGIPHIDFVLTD